VWGGGEPVAPTVPATGGEVWRTSGRRDAGRADRTRPPV